MFPALAVARVLEARGHRLLFVGTREGMEARLVAEAGYEMEFIRSGGLNRVGLRQQMQTALGLPASIAGASLALRRFRARAVFSTGGYVAGPVMLASLMGRVPLVVMEPNAIPGFANRRVGAPRLSGAAGFRVHPALVPATEKRSDGIAGHGRSFSACGRSRKASIHCVDNGWQPGSPHTQPRLARKLAVVAGKRPRPSD